MNSLENKKYWIWFSLIKGIGYKRKYKLVQVCKTPDKIYEKSKDELLKIEGVGEEIANIILNSKNDKILNYHIEYMRKNNIDLIHMYENSYPQQLKEIYDPPISLFIKGDKDILNSNAIGIVGCRDCTEYGKKAAQYFSYNLARENINVISGLAKGVDSYAHLGCLSTGKHCENKVLNCGKTIAVVGNGLDIVYPSENLTLANEIIKSGGAIISEYPCGTSQIE